MDKQTIKIGVLDYKLILTDDYIRNDNDEKLIGEINYEKLEIRIYNKMPLIKQFTTLMHEVGHAICYQYNIDFNEINTEEKIVDIFSYGMTSFYLDNKKFIENIQLQSKGGM